MGQLYSLNLVWPRAGFVAALRSLAAWIDPHAGPGWWVYPSGAAALHLPGEPGPHHLGLDSGPAGAPTPDTPLSRPSGLLSTVLWLPIDAALADYVADMGEEPGDPAGFPPTHRPGRLPVRGIGLGLYPPGPVDRACWPGAQGQQWPAADTGLICLCAVSSRMSQLLADSSALQAALVELLVAHGGCCGWLDDESGPEGGRVFWSAGAG